MPISSFPTLGNPTPNKSSNSQLCVLADQAFYHFKIEYIIAKVIVVFWQLCFSNCSLLVSTETGQISA